MTDSASKKSKGRKTPPKTDTDTNVQPGRDARDTEIGESAAVSGGTSHGQPESTVDQEYVAAVGDDSDGKGQDLLSDSKQVELGVGKCLRLTLKKEENETNAIVLVLSKVLSVPDQALPSYWCLTLQSNQKVKEPKLFRYGAGNNDIKEVVSLDTIPKEIAQHVYERLYEAEKSQKEYRADVERQRKQNDEHLAEITQRQEKVAAEEEKRQAKIRGHRQRLEKLSSLIQQWKDAEQTSPRPGTTEKSRASDFKVEDLLSSITKLLEGQPVGDEGDEMVLLWKLVHDLWSGTRAAEQSLNASKFAAEKLVGDWKKLKDDASALEERQKLAREFVEYLRTDHLDLPKTRIIKFLTERNTSPANRATMNNPLFFVIDEASCLDHLDQQRLLDYFDLNTLMNYAEWLKGEKKPVTTGLLDTLSERFARLFRTMAIDADFDSHRQLGQIWLDLVNLVEAEEQRPSYHWRLLSYLREAWEHLSIRAQDRANDRGGADTYLEWMLNEILPRCPETMYFLMLRILLVTPDSYDEQYRARLARSTVQYVRMGPQNRQERHNDVEAILPFGMPMHTAYLKALLESAL